MDTKKASASKVSRIKMNRILVCLLIGMASTTPCIFYSLWSVQFVFVWVYALNLTITYYECESCEGCPHKKCCTRAKGNRKMQLSKKFIEQRQKSLENITTEQGIQLRINRSIQVEGAFGVLKEDYGFRRFSASRQQKSAG